MPTKGRRHSLRRRETLFSERRQGFSDLSTEAAENFFVFSVLDNIEDLNLSTLMKR